ncbi:MAG TPA: S-adenosylmethionine decarboxylase [Blastocatellia bacterium]|nr:S-adenosylmethionine decarboxylase [Blastocatellia bacterium]
MNAGTEWLVDAEGCSAELIRDSQVLRILCEEIIAKLDLRVVGEPTWHRFPTPGGITGLYLLSESHLTFHTFPETGVATFNLYCCRPRPPFSWEQRLREQLRAAKVVVRTVDRGSEVVQLDLPGNTDRTSLDPGTSEIIPMREVSGL